jgi:hypothetical protein
VTLLTALLVAHLLLRRRFERVLELVGDDDAAVHGRGRDGLRPCALEAGGRGSGTCFELNRLPPPWVMVRVRRIQVAGVGESMGNGMAM